MLSCYFPEEARQALPGAPIYRSYLVISMEIVSFWHLFYFYYLFWPCFLIPQLQIPWNVYAKMHYLLLTQGMHKGESWRDFMRHRENTNRSFIINPFSLISPEMIKMPLNYKYEPHWDSVHSPGDIFSSKYLESRRLGWQPGPSPHLHKTGLQVQQGALHKVVGEMLEAQSSTCVAILCPSSPWCPSCVVNCNFS